ncbi:MAG: hypothetical protein OXU20_29780 [Myxococcales bacterium]|nr:hypothetical protein [Myxococcales bacterium]
MLVQMAHRLETPALALALVLVAGCTVKVGDDDSDADESNDETSSESDREGRSLSAPDLKVSGDDDEDEDVEAGGEGDKSDDSDDNGAVGRDDESASVGAEGTDDDLPEQESMTVDEAIPSTPMYLQAECGTIEPSDPSVSSSRSEPTSFSLGQLVGGRIDPDSVSNQEHYWRIELAKGFYHLVLDAETSDGDHTNIGLTVDWLDGDGVDQGRLLRGNDIDWRTRIATFIEVESDQTMVLRVTPNFSMEDYLLGIFVNGTAVPSPRFVDCPTLTPLSLDDPASFALASGDPSEREVWFSTELNVGDYEFIADAVQADGNSTNLQHSLYAVDQFGQEGRVTEVLRANEIDTSFTVRGSLMVGEGGLHYFRMTNRNDPLDVTLTVKEQ